MDSWLYTILFHSALYVGQRPSNNVFLCQDPNQNKLILQNVFRRFDTIVGFWENLARRWRRTSSTWTIKLAFRGLLESISETKTMRSDTIIVSRLLESVRYGRTTVLQRKWRQILRQSVGPAYAQNYYELKAYGIFVSEDGLIMNLFFFSKWADEMSAQRYLLDLLY